MNALPGFGRNDLLRATALIAVLAFPLFAYAELGVGAAALQPKHALAGAAATETAPVAAVAAPANSCAEQHWPFFSQDCLRGSTEQPRLVSLTSDAPAATATAMPAAQPAQLAEAAPGKAVKPKKHPKPHLASRALERKSPAVAYAPAPAPAPTQVLMAGW